MLGHFNLDPSSNCDGVVLEIYLDHKLQWHGEFELRIFYTGNNYLTLKATRPYSAVG